MYFSLIALCNTLNKIKYNIIFTVSKVYIGKHNSQIKN